ncbi:hypothetical protein DPMN_120016 [Dreissena polymorpha]|uniref:Uncharacterized protein n=1 Tax=Dreissena polymorpha TaxID=45954 RepID=A0A9D4JRT0_DREPO|nr:hypothetical protein DPMN_120016 [Dreissena polymorpha]
MRHKSRNLKVLIKSLGVSGLKLRGNRLVLEDIQEDNNQDRQHRAFEDSSSSEANPWQQQSRQRKNNYRVTNTDNTNRNSVRPNRYNDRSYDMRREDDNQNRPSPSTRYSNGCTGSQSQRNIYTSGSYERTNNHDSHYSSRYRNNDCRYYN